MVLAINRLAIGCHLIEVGIKNQMTVEYHPNLPATALNFLLIPLSDRLEVSALNDNDSDSNPNTHTRRTG